MLHNLCHCQKHCYVICVCVCIINTIFVKFYRLLMPHKIAKKQLIFYMSPLFIIFLFMISFTSINFSIELITIYYGSLLQLFLT